MIPRLALLCCLLLPGGMLAAADYELEAVDQAPQGFSKEVASKLDNQGQRLTGPDGAVLNIWLVKKLDVKDGFSPTFTVNYPFTPGQLIGGLVVAEGAGFKDFRAQDVPSGAYTLRYGQQPEDGNHIGTSETADFLLALPAKGDADPAVIEGFDALAQRSAKTSGTTHPAIFLLLPAEEADDGAALEHDEDREFWIVTLPANRGDVPLRVVVIGESEI